jgi:hypothetical protein
MLYAQLKPEARPLGCEEIEYLTKELARQVSGYQVIYEQRVFGGGDADRYRFSVLKWENQAIAHSRNRTVVIESHDKTEFAGMLRLLIGVHVDELAGQRAQVDGLIQSMYTQARKV